MEGKSINPALLFQRLLVVANAGNNDIKFEEVMRYELSTFPPALFENVFLSKKADKPPLMDSIEDTVKLNGSGGVCYGKPATDTYVLDGGSLLYRIGWKKKETFGNIAKIYVSFVMKTYGNATVIFYGHSQPSIKDMTHLRRQGNKTSNAIKFNINTNFLGKQEEFLKNPSNKERLIALISSELKNEGCYLIICDGDADLVIVKTGISLASKSTVTIIGEDADLLALLLHHAKDSNFKLYFRSDKASKKNIMPRTFDIGLCREILGERICNIILYLHAYTGCDSTSKISKITKSAVFKKLVNNENYFLKFCTYAQSFLIPDQTSDIIESHGIDTMKLLFQGKTMEILAVLRNKLLTEKAIKSKSFVILENLPPTDARTKFHSYRVYYQIMVWADTPLHNPEKWVWYKKHGMLYPILTDLPPAPQ